jgi:hypothetical protein
MAPQNLNQVFVANSVTMLPAGTSFLTNTAVNATQLGMWNVDAADFAVADLTGLKRIQFVQTTLGGNPFASPIIDVANIVGITYNAWADTAPMVTSSYFTDTIAITSAGVTDDGLALGASNTKSNVMLRIAVRTAPTAYVYFAKPGDVNLDVAAPVGSKKAFPLVGNFSAGRMIFNVEIPADKHNGTEADVYAKLLAAIEKNTLLNSIVYCTPSPTTSLVLNARHLGVQLDVTISFDNGTSATTADVTAGSTLLGSNYIQALSDEMSQRARYGNFNRMYFPQTMTDYAQSGFKYDTLEIAYKHDHPASTGIARAAETNILKIYFGTSSTALAAGTAANFATTFGITINTTDSERISDIALQA